MTIEIALVISGISLAFGVYQGILSTRRSHKSEVKQDTSELTTVIVKLENIGSGVNEIKAEMKSVKSDVKTLSDSLIRTEESLKSAWKRIEIIEERKAD